MKLSTGYIKTSHAWILNSFSKFEQLIILSFKAQVFSLIWTKTFVSEKFCFQIKNFLLRQEIFAFVADVLYTVQSQEYSIIKL